jgi:hypothetical protein
MESLFVLHSVMSSGAQVLEAPLWSDDGSDDVNELRLPKKRRYCGDDSSRHLWDKSGMMSTEPPTPVLLEQQEPVDDSYHKHSDAYIPRYSSSLTKQALSSLVQTTTSSDRLQSPKLKFPTSRISSGGSSSQSSDKGDASPSVRVRWTEEDDRLLISLVAEYGHNWPKISAHMDGRTSKQVKERWTNQLDPSISLEPWTGDDDQQLVLLIRQLGHAWCEIARKMTGRTESMVKNRFHANLRKRFPPQVFDPSIPLPELNFKPKSVKTKKNVISDAVRAAAAAAASRASQMGKPVMKGLPHATSFYLNSSISTPSDTEIKHH